MPLAATSAETRRRGRRTRRFGLVTLSILAALPAAAGAAPAPDGSLQAGASQRDITPPKMGYALGGWTRADRVAKGQASRLHAKTMVLRRGDRKVALVAAELFMVPGGLQQHVAEAVADLGYSVENVVISATHTHSGPGGFANWPTLNTAAPSPWMVLTNPASLAGLLSPVAADRQLYTFLVDQIAQSIRDADADLTPAVAGWGEELLYGVTKNRSLEAHLANHGLVKLPGHGKPGDDPLGAADTIDPNVDVLRVDQLHGGRRVPIGAWSQFANHGTVVKSESEVYSGDHHAAATRVFEAAVRAEGDVPPDQAVVNVYGNGAEGDQSAGLDQSGSAAANAVGTAEANAMLRAWRSAGAALSATPELDVRWTQACFCGRAVEGGKVASKAMPGVPFLTGSEEGRGPLYDVTRIPLEGAGSLVELVPGHGHKLVVPVGEFPPSVPLTTVRVGSRVIASLPGEPTKEAGARVKAAVLAATQAAGVRKVVIAGLTNEYINYITTPEEYDRQHYEGGSTMYGRLQLNLLKATLAELAARMVGGQPAPAPSPYDATRGVEPDGAPYPTGAREAAVLEQPAAQVPRMGQATLRWRGGSGGADRPVDRAFVRTERELGGVWREVDSDLGLATLWRVSGDTYTANWEIPLAAAVGGRYRLVVTANHYRVESRPFTVKAAANLVVEKVAAPWGEAAVRVSYPAPREHADLLPRPGAVSGGTVTFTSTWQRAQTVAIVNGVARAKVGGLFGVFVRAGAANDGRGNTSGSDVRAAR